MAGLADQERHSCDSNRPLRNILLILLLLTAFALRLYRLDHQEIWGDEAHSAYVVKLPLLSVVSPRTETNPPLYHFLLYLWVRLTGRSVFALRFLSLILGVLTVPLVYRLARLAFGELIGLLAALLSSISPFLVYYSQETRMYALATFATTLSMLLLARVMSGGGGSCTHPGRPQGIAPTPNCTALGRNSTRIHPGRPPCTHPGRPQGIAPAYLLATAAAIFTHYYALFVVVAQNVVAITVWRRDRNRLARWIAVQAVLALSFLPWALAQRGFLGGKASARFEELTLPVLLSIVKRSLVAFSVGITVETPLAYYLALPFVLLAALGLVAAFAPPGRRLGGGGFSDLAGSPSPDSSLGGKGTRAASPPTRGRQGGDICVSLRAISCLPGTHGDEVAVLHSFRPMNRAQEPRFTGWQLRSRGTLALGSAEGSCHGGPGQRAHQRFFSQATCLELTHMRGGGGLLAGGLPSPDLSLGRKGGWLLLAWLVIPMVFAWLVNPIMPFFQERYLLVSAPAFTILVARGLGRCTELVEGWLRGKWPWALAMVSLLLISASALSLHNWFFDDAYTKGEYGLMMDYVRDHSRPGDLLLLNNPLQEALFDYYRPPGIAHRFISRDDLRTEQRANRALAALTADYSRVWLVMFGYAEQYDPQHLAERWLSEHGYRSLYRSFLGAYLTLYVMPPAGASSTPQTVVAANLGDEVLLVGYSLSSREVRAGEALTLSLYWQALTEMERRYTVFTHLLDADNRIVAQMDSEPLGGTHPTIWWQPGEFVRDNYGLLIAPDTPPGEYLLEVGMYHLPTLERLPVLDASGKVGGDRVVLGKIVVY